jgi:two-component system phosphate regulon response regulator PhoB
MATSRLAKFELRVSPTLGKRVLIVEDDIALANVLAYGLEQAGYEVSQAADGYEALARAQRQPPDLVLLDIMLPSLDGYEVCRRLRADPPARDLRIMMLSACSRESDQVLGFSVGADDYVTKPFSMKVLLERVKALLRRCEVDATDSKIISCQGVVVDRARHVALAEEKPLDLTLTEFSLLETLVRQPGRAFRRAELIDAALGDVIVMERTIDVHILSLRRKIGDLAHLIETVRGIGYRFREPQARPALELAHDGR